MELKVTREFGDIVNLLEKLEETLETEIGLMQEEFKQRYSLDFTKEILLYSTDLVRMKIVFLFKDAVKDFERFTIILDCTEIDLNMNEIEALMSRVSRQIKDSLPKGAEPEDLEIIIKKYLRKLICRIPSKWTKPVVELFLKRFEETVNQLGVVIS